MKLVMEENGWVPHEVLDRWQGLCPGGTVEIEDGPLAEFVRKLRRRVERFPDRWPVELTYVHNLLLAVPHDGAIWPSVSAGIYELFELVECLRWLRPGDYVIDIGANIGYLTLAMAKHVGPEGNILALEPDPYNYEFLWANVALNQAKNVTPLRLAVGDGFGKAIINSHHHEGGNAGDSRTWGEAVGQTYEAPSDSIDNLVVPGRMDLVKIDVQGDECAVLRGASETLRRQGRMALLIEFWPLGLRGAGGSPEEFVDLLQGLDFRPYLLRPRKSWKEPSGQFMVAYDQGHEVKLTSWPNLLKFANTPDRGDDFVNLWCVKG